jgi:hypothetical protein
MRLPRITTRRLIALVAVSAVFALTGRILLLSIAYRHQAIAYWRMAPSRMKSGPESWPPPRLSAHDLWAQQMVARYERLARSPYLPTRQSRTEWMQGI